MIKKILSLFILLITTSSLYTQTPFIRNYTAEEYKAYTQNWSIVQDKQGLMYFGNSSGVLEYDGTNWKTITTTSTVFALCRDSSNCIYVGLKGDFGYLQADSTGSLQYKSLKDKIPEEHQNLKTVWVIKTVGEKIIFRTSDKIFVYHKGSFTVLVSDTLFLVPHVVRDNYYISDKEKGLLLLKGDSLIEMPGKEEFSKIFTYVMLPYGDDEILFVTKKDGIKIYNPKKSPCLRNPDGFEAVNEFLDKNDPYYSGVNLPNEHFAVSTKIGGILVFDKQGKVQKLYNKQNGLQSNSVRYLFTDLNGQLWVALNEGISRIENNLPFSNYTDKNGLDGSVYCMQIVKNKLFVGTSNSLYTQNKENEFERIEGTIGQNFFLFQANKKLLLGNYEKGFFELTDNNDIKQSETLKDILAIREAIRLRNHPNYILIYARNKGLVLIEYKNEQWVFKHVIKGFDENASFIQEDDKGNIWANANLHLYKLRLNESLDSVISSKDYLSGQHNLPENEIYPFSLNNGDIIFSTEKGIYRYLPEKDYFELHPDFPMLSKGVDWIKQDEKGNIWFDEVKNNITEKGVLRLVNGKHVKYKTPFFKFTGSIIPNNYAIYPYSDSIIYFGTNKGLLEYHPKQKVNYDIPFNTLIREIFAKDSLLYGGAQNTSSSVVDDPVILNYKDNNLFFHYATTFYEDSENNLFSHRLIGSSDTTWSDWKKDAKKEYTNLHEGKYVFEVKSQNIYRKFGNKASYTFEIQPPWHRTGLAYTLYGIVTIIFVWLLIRINLLRLKNLNETLKQTVEERTAEILRQKEDIEKQSKQLQITNENLLETNATKDKFFSIISHDLRSPFNSILGYADLLNEEYDSINDSEKREMINDLNKSSQHAFDMLANLLTWSRTQTGRIEINKELLNLKELVEMSIAPYAHNASKKNIKLIINIPSETLFSIDKNTAMTFIGNLVNNAIKFTPEGGLITISSNDNENHMELHIMDTGVGMTPEIIKKLFRIDENVSTAGTNNEMGTGLGLILCKEFIEKNGGNIAVKSEVGKGSEFIITLFK